MVDAQDSGWRARMERGLPAAALVTLFGGAWLAAALSCAGADAYGERVAELLRPRPPQPLPPLALPAPPPMPDALPEARSEAEAGLLRLAREEGQGAVRCELPPDTPPLDLGGLWLREGDVLTLATPHAEDAILVDAGLALPDAPPLRYEDFVHVDARPGEDDAARDARVEAERLAWIEAATARLDGLDEAREPALHLAWTGAHPGQLGTCTATAGPFALARVRVWVIGPDDARVPKAWVECHKGAAGTLGRAWCLAPEGLPFATGAHHDSIGSGRLFAESVAEGDELVLRLRRGPPPPHGLDPLLAAELALGAYPEEEAALRAYAAAVEARWEEQTRARRALKSETSYLRDTRYR